MALVLSEDAEDAIFQVNTTRAIIPRPRYRRSLWRRRSRVQDRVLAELAVGRMVAAGEAYLLMRATRKLKPELLDEIPPPKSDPTMKRLRSAATDFGELRAIWQKDIGLDLETLNPTFNDFSDLRQLRHVLVHRLGHWQPGLDDPKKKRKIEERIRALGIDPQRYRGPVPLDSDEVSRSADLVLRLVDSVDPVVP